MSTLRAAGTEPEADLGFGVLHALLRPLLHRADGLPRTQREVLQAALSHGRASAEQRFAVGAATLGLLATEAEERTVAVLIDDAQWWDVPSLAAISFAVRRLEADAVAVLIATRPEGLARLRSARLRTIALSPLGHEDASLLLAETDRSMGSVARNGVLEAAHGNPLALRELSTRLTEEQRLGIVPLPAELPAGAAVQRAFAGAFAELSPGSRAALLATAIAGENPDALGGALVALGVSRTDLEAAETGGLLSVTGGQVSFRHPLVRAAVLGAAPPGEVRRAHAAVADGLPDGEVRARHLAAAAVGPDETVAAELERAAGAALASAAPAVAATLLAEAADLTPQPSRAADRRSRAADAAWLAGLTTQARALAEGVGTSGADAAAVVRALHLRGRIAHQTEPASRARELLLEAAELAESLGPEVAVPVLADTVASCVYAGDASGALSVARRLASVARDDGGLEEYLCCLQLGVALALNGRGSEGAPLLRRAIELVETVDVLRDDPHHLGSAAMAPAWVDEPERGRMLADRAIARARELGALASLPTSLKFGAWADFDSGRWDAALAGASEATALAREMGQTSQLCANLGIVAAVHAGRGDDDACRAAVAEGLALADELELAWHRSGLIGWLGLLELGLGRSDDAAASLGESVALLERLGNLSAAEAPFANLVEALVRAGRLEEARARLDAYAAIAEEEGRPVGIAWALRLRGMLAPDEEVEPLFGRAAELLEGVDPFMEARTWLGLGERLRRAGERRRARSALEAALAGFERLGARVWAERATGELVASGARRRRLGPETRDELTPQELQVALQVARGLKNREIAQALYLSPKTVEFHLTRVYRKLDLHARAELIERFRRQVE